MPLFHFNSRIGDVVLPDTRERNFRMSPRPARWLRHRQGKR
jgi:hypothetical protein